MSVEVASTNRTHTPELAIGHEAVTAGRTITESDVVSFASLTGDWHPQHADEEWASRGRFGGRVAHGMLVLSYAVGLVPFDPERVVALRGLHSIAFKRPVRIGDTIRVETKVESARPLDDEHSLVTMAWRILNQDGKLVARAKVDALCRTAEPEPADEPQPIAAGVAAHALDGGGAGAPAGDLSDLYGDRLAL